MYKYKKIKYGNSIQRKKNKGKKNKSKINHNKRNDIWTNKRRTRTITAPSARRIREKNKRKINHNKGHDIWTNTRRGSRVTAPSARRIKERKTRARSTTRRETTYGKIQEEQEQ